MIRAPLTYVKVMGSVCLLLLFLSCGWERTMVFTSQSGRSTLEVWQTPVDHTLHMRIDVVTTNGRHEVYRSPNEAILRFIHVYWSPDETKVGLLAAGFGVWEIAFDLKNERTIPFSQIQDQVFRSVVESYHVGTRTEVSAWIDSPEAASAFARLHPEIKLH
jgi:hypothetical protein